uniref:Uncharacterized protein n=1 Tax=Ditylenchus dipsaci TaxID=166011 RepID=A0A915D3U0_9BILA
MAIEEQVGSDLWSATYILACYSFTKRFLLLAGVKGHAVTNWTIKITKFEKEFFHPPFALAQGFAEVFPRGSTAFPQTDENVEDSPLLSSLAIQLTAFLLHIWYLMGYNNRPAKIVDEEIEEEPAAEQEMDEERGRKKAVENIEEFNLY